MQKSNNSMEKVKSKRKKAGGAKQVYFQKEGYETKVLTRSICLQGMTAPYSELENGHGFIKIDKHVIEEAKTKRLVEEHFGKKNTFYICKPNQFMNFRSNRVLLLCNVITPNVGAFQIMDNSEVQLKIVKMFNIFLKNKSGEKLKPGRHLSKLTFTFGPIKGLQAQAALLFAWSENIIPTVKGLEAHHVLAEWDMRTNAVKCLTPEQHDLEHKKTSNRSHTMIVHITSLSELIAFMNWIETEDYMRLFI